MNQFDVIAGQTMITTVSVAGALPFPRPSNNGTPVTIAVWSDPNGDGDPHNGLSLDRSPAQFRMKGPTPSSITRSIRRSMLAHSPVSSLVT